MARSAADEKILSYNDVVLRRSDLDILSGRHFLNDRILEFYFSYLSSTLSGEDIVLLPPGITFWTMNCPFKESLNDFLSPLKLSDRRLVLFPVNDNEDVTRAEGGSHWSLLVYERNTNVFVHHDSNDGANRRCARKLQKAVASFVSASDSGAKYLELDDSPQQVNDYDCGLYVAATARAILGWSDQCNNEHGDELWFEHVKERVTPSAVSGMRNEILQLIKGLMSSK